MKTKKKKFIPCDDECAGMCDYCPLIEDKLDDDISIEGGK